MDKLSVEITLYGKTREALRDQFDKWFDGRTRIAAGFVQGEIDRYEYSPLPAPTINGHCWALRIWLMNVKMS